MKKNALDNFVLFILAITILINLLFVSFTHNSWNSTVTKLVPLQKTALKLRDNFSQAHLWLEEALAGDKYVNIQTQVFDLYLHDAFAEFTKEFNNETEEDEIKRKLYVKLIEIDNESKHLYHLTKQRWENSKEYGIGSDVDQEFDKMFNQIMSKLQDVSIIIDKKIAQDISNKNINFQIMIVLFLLINLLFFVSLYYINSYKSKLEKKLLANEKQLQKAEKLASMGEMIGNIAHQWRQPLSIISTVSTSYKIKYEFNQPIEVEEMINDMEHINNNAQYLSTTIDDFRNFIKGDSNYKKFYINHTLKKFLRLMSTSVKNHELEVVINQSDDVKLHGYPNELIQCFVNIFNNAKDALVENQTNNERFIFIDIVKKKKKLTIIFKDNAGGIPEDIIEKIFDPYFTTKHQSQGTGLGLHMTYNLIVNFMDGKIEVHNKEFTYNNKAYKGAEFKISIPLDTQKITTENKLAY